MSEIKQERKQNNKCPSCGCPLEISADGTRGYCKVKICNAMVKLDNKLYGMGEGNADK